MTKLKVIFCTDGIFPNSIGGMQRHSRYLIEYLAKNDTIDLIVIHPHEEKIFPMYSTVHEFSVVGINPKKNYLLECYRYSKRVFKVINQHRNFIVYSQGLSVWSNIGLISDKIIINPHGLEPFQTITLIEKIKAIPFQIVFKYLFNRSSYVVSLGGGLTTILQKALGHNKERVIVLPNGVKPAEGFKHRDFNRTKINLLFVARFAQNKGIHILIQAINELNSEGWENKLQFNLGGKGPLFEFYTTNFSLSNINYLGFVSDEQLIELYKNADVFVFPTLFEGMPTVVLEAMSYGLPIIVSNVGATAELVDDSNGYLIEKNNVVELKKAIIDFYNSSVSQKEAFSRSSVLKVKETYDWEIVSKRHVDVFKKLSLGNK